jgi:hypothetical protein
MSPNQGAKYISLHLRLRYRTPFPKSRQVKEHKLTKRIRKSTGTIFTQF